MFGVGFGCGEQSGRAQGITIAPTDTTFLFPRWKGQKGPSLFWAHPQSYSHGHPHSLLQTGIPIHLLVLRHFPLTSAEHRKVIRVCAAARSQRASSILEDLQIHGTEQVCGQICSEENGFTK